MHLVCLCPTYGRPSLVRNALALFLGQQLRPGDSAHFLILDDANQIRTQHGGRHPLTWQCVAHDTWIPLTRKYAPMLALAGPADAYVVWDDDDVYLPWHLAAHATTLQTHAWSHPSRAYSTYGIDPLTQTPNEKHLSGRHYHGALAIRADLMQILGGWPDTDLSDYDKQQLARCRHHAGPPGDPCQHYPPSYVYRWQDTSRDHCSGRIRDGQYQPPRIQDLDEHDQPIRIDTLAPQHDASTRALLARLDDFQKISEMGQQLASGQAAACRPR